MSERKSTAAEIFEKTASLKGGELADAIKFLPRLKQANAVIIRSVEAWTGFSQNPQGQLPVVRGGSLVAYLTNQNALAGDPISNVTFGFYAKSNNELKASIRVLKNLKKSLSDFLEAAGTADFDTVRMLQSHGSSFPNDDKLEARMIFAIGHWEAAVISTTSLLEQVDKRLELIEYFLSERPSGQGRPRFEPRYAVARNFARLFAKVTGETPTYSEGRDGLSGKFTPALRALFDALEWDGADLEGPAKAAIDALEPDDYLPPQSHVMGGLLGWAEK